jgi:3-oxoacyl-[acyl-carrier protein] reductase
MDLGLTGRRAIVCAASSGLGRACAEQLALEGAQVTIVARTESRLKQAAEEIGERSGTKVDWIAADVSRDDSIAKIASICPNPDILVNNAGGPPTGNFREWDRATWYQALDANMLSAIFLARAFVDGMIERRFGRIINITSSTLRSPMPILGLSTGARAGLTGFFAGLAREVAEHGVTINNILPGPFDTDRLRSNFEARAKKLGADAAELTETSRKANPMKRFGKPEELGAMCAFLCGTRAAYLNGQNILLDGGQHSSLI